jgi:PAS domain S-box-containing protein
MTPLLRIFCADGFMPHGMCYLWRPAVLTLHVVSDSLITLAYFSIPFTLIYFARKRADLRYTWMLLCFAVFIVACGSSHLMEIVTIWYPAYWTSGGIKAVTALASVPTAILLIKLVPVALKVPSPAALEAANTELAHEVIERRRAEEELRKSNEVLEQRVAERTAALEASNQGLQLEIRERKKVDELLTLTLASIQDGVVVTDENGAITFLNDAAARLIERDPTDAVNLPIGCVFDIRRTPGAEPLLIGRAGRELPVDVLETPLQSDQPNMRGVVYTLRDYRERKRAEDIERRMAALVEYAEDAIITTDLDGAILSWNPAAERLLEYRAEEMMAQPITRLLPDDREDEETSILSNIRRGEAVAHFETVRRRKSGSLVHVSLTISPLRDRHGAIVGASKIMRDITDRRHYLEQLQRLNAELQSRVRARTAELRERDVLIQEIHHRVKNNLQVISSLISMQVRSIEDRGIRTALRECQSRVETMAQIHEMLYQSKDYARVPFPRYAKELTTRVLSAAGLSPDGVTIAYRMADLFLPVDQAIPCGLILNELISNSLKHAFPSGTGNIEIEFRAIDKNRVLLAVSDDGIGMKREFDPAKSKSLGVALVLALVKQLDGALELLRQPGTTFRITFPWSEQA